MKRIILSCLPVFVLTSGLSALVNLGDARIDLSVAASATYDTEIRSRDEGRDDFVFGLRSALTYKRPSPRMDIAATIGVMATRYLDYTEFNDEDLFFDLSISPSAQMRTSRFTVSGDLILNTETRSDPDVGDIVTTRNYGASAQVVYDPNTRYTVQGNAGYRREDPRSSLYSELDRYNAGLTVYVPIARELDVSAGAAYIKTESDDNIRLDNETYTGFLGLRGALTPKLNGSLQAGLQRRELDFGDSSTAPYFSAGLTWTVDRSTSVGLVASRQLGTKINDRTSESFSVDLNVRRQLNQDWSAAAGVGYLDDELQGFGVATREDEEIYGYASLNYKIVRWGSLGAEIRYLDRSSNVAAFDYDRLQAGLRFSAGW